jgi:hypothetical protein
MVAITPQPVPLTRSKLFPERLTVRVPWAKALTLRDRLLAMDVPATICFEPADRTALLEFWPGVDQNLVHAALRELGTFRD